MMKYFNIQMAAQISGLSTHTIRAWEKRYGALTPSRSSSGRRQYSADDLDRLTLLAQLTQMGNSIGQIANLPDDELKEIHGRLNMTRQRVQETKKSVGPISDIDLNQTLNGLFLALGGYKIDVISHELAKAKFSLGPGDFATKILDPLLAESHHRLGQGQLTQAQVQALYAVIKFHAGSILYSSFDKKGTSSNRLALATPSGELYVFGIMLSGLLCCEHGHQFFYMSSNLPAFSIAEGASATDANIIILGIHDIKSVRPSIADFLEELTGKVGPKVKVVLVGDADFGERSLQSFRNVLVLPKLEQVGNFLQDLN